MPVTDTRQAARVVAPYAWRKPVPEFPALLPIYEQRRQDGWSAVLREYDQQIRDYHKQFSLWVTQQTQETPTTPP